MIERQKAVAEVILIRSDFNLIATPVFIHPRKSCLRIRFPWVEHVHPVFTRVHFAQILNAVILLIAVDVVKLLLRPATFTNRPDGMVQINNNQFLAYSAINGQVAFFTMLLASYRHAVAAACQPPATGIVSVVHFYAKQQFLLLRFC